MLPVLSLTEMKSAVVSTCFLWLPHPASSLFKIPFTFILSMCDELSVWLEKWCYCVELFVWLYKCCCCGSPIHHWLSSNCFLNLCILSFPFLFHCHYCYLPIQLYFYLWSCGWLCLHWYFFWKCFVFLFCFGHLFIDCCGSMWWKYVFCLVVLVGRVVEDQIFLM